MEFFLQQSLNGLALASVYGLFALGFSLVLANLKVFHVAHEGVFTWGAVIGWWLMTRWDLPFALAVPAVVLCAGALNVVAYLLVIRHLEGRENSELAGFISSLGGLIVLVEVADLVLGGVAVRLPFDALEVRTWTLAGVNINNLQVLFGVAMLVAFGLLQWLVDRTQIGREMKAVAYNREVAAMLGVNPTRVSAVVFFVSGALGGLAAMLVAVAFNVIDANIGASYLVTAIAVTVIGGFGSVKGVLIGAVAVGLVSSHTTAYFTSTYRDVVVFVLLLLFLVVRPSGLFRLPVAGERA